MKATTHLIGGIPIAGHVSGYMLEVFHWLPICQQIIFRIAALVWQCLLRLATTCLHTLCSPTPGTRGCSILNSVERGGVLLVPSTSMPQPLKLMAITAIFLSLVIECQG